MTLNKTILFITCFLGYIQIFSSILIETNGRKDRYCFHKHIDSGDTVHLSYVISGEQEEKVQSVLLNGNTVVYHQESADHGDFSQERQDSGMYKLCFIPQSTNHYYISFEFFTNTEKGHTLDMAKDENLHEMKKDVNDISLMFEEMEKNVKFIMDRRNSHTHIISDIGVQIRHINYLKIGVILLVSLLQVFLIQKFFGSSRKTSTYGNSSTLFEMSVAESL